MKSSASPPTSSRSNLRPALLILGALLGYILAFFWLNPIFGVGVASLSVLPVVLTGWSFGWMAGVAGGLLSLVLNAVLVELTGIYSWEQVLLSGGGPGTALIVLLGAAAGYVGRMNDRLGRQMALSMSMEAAFRQGEQHFRGLFEHSPISLWEEDFSGVKNQLNQLKENGIRDFRAYLSANPQAVDAMVSQVRVVDVNQATLELYRCESKEELLANLHRVFTPESYAVFLEELITIAEGRKVFEGEGQNRSLSGELLEIYVRWSVAPGYENSLAKVFVSIIDISDRKRAEERLRRNAAQAEALLQISAELSAASLEAQSVFEIIVQHTSQLFGDACLLSLVSEDGDWLEVAASSQGSSQAARRLRVGAGAAGRVVLSGQPVLVPVLSESGPGAEADPAGPHAAAPPGVHSLLIVPLIASGRAIGTLSLSRNDPYDPYTIEDEAFLQSLANQAVFAIQNARLHEQVAIQARMDTLTGVFNRGHFFKLAELEFQRAQRYALTLSAIMLDLDDFKLINDVYGHVVGDQVLREAAARCRTNVRSSDILGRYGGEEFAILLPETDPSGAYHLGERLCRSIGDVPVKTGAGEVRVTASFGIATRGEETPNLLALLECADEAMYAAKKAGRNQVASR